MLLRGPVSKLRHTESKPLKTVAKGGRQPMVKAIVFVTGFQGWISRALFKRGEPFDSVEPQPLDLRVRVSTGPSTPAFASTEPRSTVFSSSYDHKTRTLTATTNIVETEYLEPNQILRTSTTKTHTTSPKTQKGNYFLIDSLLTPARSSDIQLDSTCKVVERTPVSFGCSVGASFRSPCSTIDISKRSRIVPERDVARTPATSVLSAHRTNGQQENAATPMKKLKREPDDNSATMTPPPNICVDDEVSIFFGSFPYGLVQLKISVRVLTLWTSCTPSQRSSAVFYHVCQASRFFLCIVN
ncbi:hypothetical protein Q1695_000562 [Nippostrongylus brasiliensis]|nr:hypothetical protein Q1695_000562 [Nippostrongylus brasiliensis]